MPLPLQGASVASSMAKAPSKTWQRSTTWWEWVIAIISHTSRYSWTRKTTLWTEPSLMVPQEFKVPLCLSIVQRCSLPSVHRITVLSLSRSRSQVSAPVVQFRPTLVKTRVRSSQETWISRQTDLARATGRILILLGAARHPWDGGKIRKISTKSNYLKHLTSQWASVSLPRANRTRIWKNNLSSETTVALIWETWGRACELLQQNIFSSVSKI